MTAIITDPLTDDEIRHCIALYDLERAVLDVLAGASPSISEAERTAVLAEAMTARECSSDSWCAACQADHEGLCKVHECGVELADSIRRHSYRQLPGRPLIDVDL